MAVRLTASQLEELEAVFMMYDKEKVGVIKSRLIGRLIRHLGQNPTDNELQVQRLINFSDQKGSFL